MLKLTLFVVTLSPQGVLRLEREAAYEFNFESAHNQIVLVPVDTGWFLPSQCVYVLHTLYVRCGR